MDCPARLTIKRIVRYPDFQSMSENTSVKTQKTKMLRSMKDAWPLRLEEYFLLSLPKVKCHRNHSVGKQAGMLQNVDDAIKCSMVSQGVNFLPEMRPHILEYLKTMFMDALLDRYNRRYWPTDGDTANHMHSAFSSMMLRKTSGQRVGIGS
ncbi:uncharacterized protein [Watersipora subatra]|uniref:uncharacterized protein n=1 Tax=Watersipora subatra TaxID=2589382 RepID=UPI00355BA4C3